MAIFYVDDSAGGANNGTSWTDAWVSIGSALTVAAGSEIWIASTHDETGAATYNPDFVNGTNALPIIVVSVATADDSYASRGATIRGTNSLVIAGVVEMFGIVLDSGIGDLFFCDDSDENQSYWDCQCDVGTGAGDDLVFNNGVGTFLKMCNSTVTTQGNLITGSSVGSHSRFVNVDFIKAGSDTALIQSLQSRRSVVEFQGCDLTDWDFLVNATTDGSEIRISDCQLKPGFTLFNGSVLSDMEILLEHSSSGTDIQSPSPGLEELVKYEGTVKAVTAQYRTGGANTGYNAFSYEMVANANSLEYFRPLCTPWRQKWLNGGQPVTIEFYVASSASLNDDDFWVEMFSPSELPAATTRATYKTSAMVSPLETPAVLTTDSVEIWNGSGVSTKQKVSFTCLPDISGPISFRFCLAKPSTTVYVCPKEGIV